MNKISLFIIAFFIGCLTIACDDDNFEMSPSQTLTFSSDTIRFDTLFSTVPSSTRSFWAFNKTGSGIRCTSVRQERGNQSGFRVNVDGAFLGQASGYAVSDIELRKKDSIRIFVEATFPNNYKGKPSEIEDNLVFTLENGKQQKVNLNAFAWDCNIVRNLRIDKDTTLAADTKPLVVYGPIEVAKGATLTLAPGLTLYFHGNAGIDVHGRLVSNGTADAKVVLRGDRLDRMFDYLPYDRVSGQWNGLHFYEESYDNMLRNTDIHSTYDGIVVDSSALDRTTLTLENSTVHNCQGYGLKTTNAVVNITNCQLTNTLHDCLFVDGGNVSINATTMAQFYPFDSQRGAALRFSSVNNPLQSLVCKNSIVTGYADDLLFSESEKDSDHANEFQFYSCLLRTPKVETEDSIRFKDVVYEDVSDTTSYGLKNFVLIDGDHQQYDFHLKEKAAAIGIADKTSMPSTDLTGQQRDDTPDAGGYEFVATENKEEEK